MTDEQRRLTIEQLKRFSKFGASLGETVDYTEFAIEALEQMHCEDYIDENIHWLSDLRSNYSCFDEEEQKYYHALSVAIKAIKQQACNDMQKKTRGYYDDKRDVKTKGGSYSAGLH